MNGSRYHRPIRRRLFLWVRPSLLSLVKIPLLKVFFFVLLLSFIRIISAVFRTSSNTASAGVQSYLPNCSLAFPLLTAQSVKSVFSSFSFIELTGVSLLASVRSERVIQSNFATPPPTPRSHFQYTTNRVLFGTSHNTSPWVVE